MCLYGGIVSDGFLYVDVGIECLNEFRGVVGIGTLRG
jgi:hypothetical protein